MSLLLGADFPEKRMPEVYQKASRKNIYVSEAARDMLIGRATHYQIALLQGSCISFLRKVGLLRGRQKCGGDSWTPGPVGACKLFQVLCNSVLKEWYTTGQTDSSLCCLVPAARLAMELLWFMPVVTCDPQVRCLKLSVCEAALLKV